MTCRFAVRVAHCISTYDLTDITVMNDVICCLALRLLQEHFITFCYHGNIYHSRNHLCTWEKKGKENVILNGYLLRRNQKRDDLHVMESIRPYSPSPFTIQQHSGWLAAQLQQHVLLFLTPPSGSVTIGLDCPIDNQAQFT